MTLADNRREPDDPSEPRTEIVTGVHRLEVVKRLERLSPTPSKPPREQPGAVLDYMLALAQMHRNDAAYAAARSEEAATEVKAEIDEIKVHVLRLSGKVERLEDRVGIVVNTQIAQNSEITSLRTSIGRMQETFEGAITNVHIRVNALEEYQKRMGKRVDEFERGFAHFRELIMKDVNVRERQLAFDEAHNGNAPATPRQADDEAGAASGPPTKLK